MSDSKKPGEVRAHGYTLRPDGSIVFHDDVPEDVRASILVERGEQLEREARRRQLWGEPGPGAMTRLARMFPSLRRAAGVDPWDAIQLLEWLCTSPAVTSGSHHAAMFVLGVWNTGTDWAEVAKETFEPRRCERCAGVGRIDEDGNNVRWDAPRKVYLARRTDDDDVVREVEVKTYECQGCDGQGKWTPGLKRGRFDVFSALSSWDLAHREAFQTWVKYPFWP